MQSAQEEPKTRAHTEVGRGGRGRGARQRSGRQAVARRPKMAWDVRLRERGCDTLLFAFDLYTHT